MPVNITPELVRSLLDRINELTNQNQELLQTVSALKATIEERDETIRVLQEQKNKNSHNSSKPPSSDGYNKPPAPKSLRKKSGKKSGGQEGHEGKNLAKAVPDHVVGCMPSVCAKCQYHAECMARAKVIERRQVFDAVLKTEVTEYDKLRVTCCPLHGWTGEGCFPEGIKAAVQYGENLQALLVAFNTVGAVSVCRTKEILSNIFGIPLSEGTILSMISHCASRLTTVLSKIGKLVLSSSVTNADETGFRVDGKLHWAHVLCNGSYTCIVLNQKRGWAGMEEIGLLPQFNGILVHDCWAPYWSVPGMTGHALCCAHLLRELIGTEENNPSLTWPKEMIDLLLEMKRIRDKAFDRGKEGLSRYYLHKFSSTYDRIIETAYQETPEPPPTPGKKRRGKKKRGKVLALLDRLKAHKGSVCLFIRNFSVPFDNNQAERDLRMIKAKTKISGCFRTQKGAQEYLDIMSYVSTAKKLGCNAFEAIKNAVLGTPDFIFAEGC